MENSLHPDAPPKVTQRHGPTGAPYEVIEVPNRLAAKAGDFRASSATSTEITAELSRIAQGYPDSVRADFERLLSLWASLQEGPDPEKERQFMAIAADFKIQAPVFGYDLVGAIAASLCIIIEGKMLRRPSAHPAIGAHLDALDAVLKLSLKGDGGRAGREVVERLREVVIHSARKR